MLIEENVKARQAAQEVISFALEFIGDQGLSSEAIKRAHEIISERFAVEPEQPDRLDPELPMTDAEARDFETTVCPFRPHKGRLVKNVPIEAINWLNDQPDFRRQLRRYCASERWKLIQESTEPIW